MKKYYKGRIFPGVMELRTRAVELWLQRKPPCKPGNLLSSKYNFTLDYTSSDCSKDESDTKVPSASTTTGSEAKKVNTVAKLSISTEKSTAKTKKSKKAYKKKEKRPFLTT